MYKGKLAEAGLWRRIDLYAYLIRLQIINSLAYRFEFFSAIGTNVFFLFGSVYLWKSAYRGIDDVGGVAEGQMITYAIVSVLMGALFTITVDRTLFVKIREGSIAVDFIRPTDLPSFWLGEDVGQMLSAAARVCLPVLVVAALFFSLPLPADLWAGLLFIPCCVFSYIILWQISALVGLTAFWVIELGNTAMVKEIVVVILSGKMIPLWLFPEFVQQALRFLPFQYIYQSPLEVFIGRAAPAEALHIIGVQGVWVILLSFALRRVWSRAQRRLLVQGG